MKKELLITLALLLVPSAHVCAEVKASSTSIQAGYIYQTGSGNIAKIPRLGHAPVIGLTHNSRYDWGTWGGWARVENPFGINEDAKSGHPNGQVVTYKTNFDMFYNTGLPGVQVWWGQFSSLNDSVGEMFNSLGMAYGKRMGSWFVRANVGVEYTIAHNKGKNLDFEGISGGSSALLATYRLNDRVNLISRVGYRFAHDDEFRAYAWNSKDAVNAFIAGSYKITPKLTGKLLWRKVRNWGGNGDTSPLELNFEYKL
ncbi:hypothetical protein [Ferrimonas pelagia]